MIELDTLNKHSNDSHLKMHRVIVIDDDNDSVETLSALLEQKGVQVVGMGYNGKDAFNLYVQEKPDFVILDMKMPEYDGPYAINKIKQHDPKAKIIAVTAFTHYQFKTGEVLTSLKKPYDISELLNVIEEASNQLAKLRICITIDSELVKKIRMIQGKEIQKSKKSISFSQVLENVVNQGLKK